MKYSIWKLLSKVDKKICPNITHEIIQVFNEYLEPHYILMLRMTCKSFASLNIDKSVDIVALIIKSPNCRSVLKLVLDMKYPISPIGLTNILSADSVDYLANITSEFSSKLLYQTYLAKAPKCIEYVINEMMCWRCLLINRSELSKKCIGHREILRSDIMFLQQSMLVGTDFNDRSLRLLINNLCGL